ncbi:MAG: type II toxin-antitoxin system Phd/YefM family antitoxin [Candidatus Gottesmanbacteria bacterium]|nr:type II toxin-antitoxin system Phd/YefM family antitoxin [Candidatus Gottesmanbacteria bacterium]
MSPYSFPTTISARDIQRGYKKVFDTVKKTKKPVVVMANNNPQAAIISVEMLARYNRLVEEQELWNVIDQIRAKNADKNEDEVMRDVTEAVEDVRQKIYEKTFGRS